MRLRKAWHLGSLQISTALMRASVSLEAWSLKRNDTTLHGPECGTEHLMLGAYCNTYRHVYYKYIHIGRYIR